MARLWSPKEKSGQWISISSSLILPTLAPQGLLCRILKPHRASAHLSDISFPAHSSIYHICQRDCVLSAAWNDPHGRIFWPRYSCRICVFPEDALSALPSLSLLLWLRDQKQKVRKLPTGESPRRNSRRYQLLTSVATPQHISYERPKPDSSYNLPTASSEDGSEVQKADRQSLLAAIDENPSSKGGNSFARVFRPNFK